MKVKVCGVTRPEDARLAAGLGAWAVGMIFVPGSPRALDERRAREVRAAIPKWVLAVGVFVDAARATLEAAAYDYGLDALQLHGSEKPEDCLGLPVPVYKTLCPVVDADLDAFDRYEVDGFLVETVRRSPGGREALTPEELERRWTLARRAGRFGDVLLAGRLDADNVARAVERSGLPAVDVCGGVESSPGHKDAARLRAFFKAVEGL